MEIIKIDTGKVVEPTVPPKKLPVPGLCENVKRSLRNGFEGFKRIWPASVLLWIVGLLGALVPTVMVGRVLRLAVGKSLFSDDLLSGFDAAWYNEFVHAHAPRLEAVPFISVLVAIGVLVLYLLVLGGSLDQLIQGDPFRLKRLIRSGAGHLRAMLGLTLCFLPLLAVAILIDRAMGSLLRVPLDRTSTEIFAVALNLLRFFLFVLLFVVFRVALDYARVALVKAADGAVFRAMGRAFLFIRRRVVLAFLPLLAGWSGCLVLLGIYAIISSLISPDNVVTVTLLILLQSLFLVACQGVRLFVYSWESSILRIDGSSPAEPESQA